MRSRAHIISAVILTVALLTGAAAVATAAVSKTINYQAVMLSGGAPATAPVSVVFTIYDAPTGGNNLWSETRVVSPDSEGRVNMRLGETNAIDETVFNGADRWLGVKVDTDAELSPRTAMSSAPYSFRVETVDGAKGGDISGNVRVLPSDAKSGAPASSQVALVALNGDSVVLGPADQAALRAVDSFGEERASLTVDGSGGGLLSIRLDGSDQAVHSAMSSSYYNDPLAKDPTVAAKRMEIGQAGMYFYNESEEELFQMSEAASGVPQMVLTDQSAAKDAAAVAQILRIGGVDAGAGKNVVWQVEDGNGDVRMEATIDNTSGEPELAFFAPTAKGPAAVQKIMSISSAGLTYYDPVTGDPQLALSSEGDVSGVGQASMGVPVSAKKKGERAVDTWSTIFGFNNIAQSDTATLSGGHSNQAISFGSTISGGAANTTGTMAKSAVTSLGETIGGGATNTAIGRYSVIAGGDQNATLNEWSTVGGGIHDTASGAHSTVSGGSNNRATQTGATVGGGANNLAEAASTTVSGGGGNTASDVGAAVGGGQNNVAAGIFATISGGDDCETGFAYSTVGGGQFNKALGTGGTVSGGRNNAVRASYATVSGGGGSAAADSNSAWGAYSTIPGGRGNVTTQDYSYAAGRRAKANHVGAYVWADDEDVDFPSQRPNQYRVRANGGLRLDDDTSWVDMRDDLTTYMIQTSTGAHLTRAGVWLNASDESLKENFTPVDGDALLDKIASLPISEWNYKVEGAEVRHIGPMAQDFHRVFGIGNNDVTIGSLDPAGIALAAIQELHKKTNEIDKLNARVAELQKLVEQLIAERQ